MDGNPCFNTNPRFASSCQLQLGSNSMQWDLLVWMLVTIVEWLICWYKMSQLRCCGCLLGFYRWGGKMTDGGIIILPSNAWIHESRNFNNLRRGFRNNNLVARSGIFFFVILFQGCWRVEGCVKMKDLLLLSLIGFWLQFGHRWGAWDNIAVAYSGGAGWSLHWICSWAFTHAMGEKVRQSCHSSDLQQTCWCAFPIPVNCHTCITFPCPEPSLKSLGNLMFPLSSIIFMTNICTTQHAQQP